MKGKKRGQKRSGFRGEKEGEGRKGVWTE